MSRNHDYITGNLLDHLYRQEYYKPIDVYLSKQTNTTIPQQINFAEKLEDDDSTTMFLSLKSFKKIILNIYLDLLNVSE